MDHAKDKVIIFIRAPKHTLYCALNDRLRANFQLERSSAACFEVNATYIYSSHMSGSAEKIYNGFNHLVVSAGLRMHGKRGAISRAVVDY